MIDSDSLLAGVVPGLRVPLIEEYRGICSAFNEGRWKLAALDAGRFCEVVYTVLHGLLSGSQSDSPQKPSNFVQACRNLEAMPPASVGDRSLRILIPRLLPALYEIRNNRNVGHVGGDVIPNKMDAALVRESTSWILAELVRIVHGVPTTTAQVAVDALIDRSHPLVWKIEGIKRVLDPSMKMADRILVLLYTTPGWVDFERLKVWLRNNPNVGRVVSGLFDKHLVERDQSRVTITPLGILHVEKKKLLNP